MPNRKYIVIFRFQGQVELSYYSPSDFQAAIEEAFLADRGFTERLIADINLAAGNTGYDETFSKGMHEAAGSKYAGSHFPHQVSLQVLFNFRGTYCCCSDHVSYLWDTLERMMTYMCSLQLEVDTCSIWSFHL